MYCRQRDTIPTTEFNEILDRRHSNLRYPEKGESVRDALQKINAPQAWKDSEKGIEFSLLVPEQSAQSVSSIASWYDTTITSQTVSMLSMFRALNNGHMVKLISTSPRPKSSPPGKRAITSRLVSGPPALAESDFIVAEASSLMRSPARGAGCERIFEIWRLWDCTSLEKRAQERVK